MDINKMTNHQILMLLAENINKKRLQKNITSEVMAKDGGHNAQTFSNFVNRGVNIRVETLIQMLRGIGELDKLESLFSNTNDFSPYGNEQKLKSRIRTKKGILGRPSNSVFMWGEDK